MHIIRHKNCRWFLLGSLRSGEGLDVKKTPSTGKSLRRRASPKPKAYSPQVGCRRTTAKRKTAIYHGMSQICMSLNIKKRKTTKNRSLRNQICVIDVQIYSTIPKESQNSPRFSSFPPPGRNPLGAEVIQQGWGDLPKYGI